MSAWGSSWGDSWAETWEAGSGLVPSLVLTDIRAYAAIDGSVDAHAALNGAIAARTAVTGTPIADRWIE